MCGLITAVGLGIAAVISSAVGAGVSAYGVSQQQKAANASAEYNAKVMQRNSEIAKMQGAEATKQGELDAREHRLKVAGIIGSQKSAYGASGVLIDQGSPLDVAMSSAAEGELDAMTIKRNAQRAAYGYQTQALNYEAESSLSRMSKRSVGLATGTSLLTGAANTLNTGFTAATGIASLK